MASKETSANGTIPVASNRVLVTVEVPEDDVHIMSKNQIHFKIDNQTPFTLSPMTTTFADWGDFTSGPTTVNPYTNNGYAGHVLSSRSPVTGSAGLVGYSLSGPTGANAFLRMLGSNPYASLRSNYAYMNILNFDQPIDQQNYNRMYYQESTGCTMPFEGKALHLQGSIGQADDATATFILTFK